MHTTQVRTPFFANITLKNMYKGRSYEKRVKDINKLFDECQRKHKGMSNREIWRRYIYPAYGISECTLYNMFKKGAEMGI